MKRYFIWLFTVVILNLVIGTCITRSQTINPFPVSEGKKKEVLQKNEGIIQFYNIKFKGITLEYWPIEARDSFLTAKARKLNIMFAPNYYREYNSSPTIEAIKVSSKYSVYPEGLTYEITFFVDPTKEKLISKKLFSARVWNTGEANGFIVPVYTTGLVFRPPIWEDGRYQDWLTRNVGTHAFQYITGYENKPTETINQKFQRERQGRKEKEKKAAETKASQ